MYQIGDVVQRKYNGKTAVVRRIDDRGRVWCFWVDGYETFFYYSDTNYQLLYSSKCVVEV